MPVWFEPVRAWLELLAALGAAAAVVALVSKVAADVRSLKDIMKIRCDGREAVCKRTHLDVDRRLGRLEKHENGHVLEIPR